MTDKPIVSEILPAGAACAQWLAEGDNARAVPFVAFAAGWKARDAEVEALVEENSALREALIDVGGTDTSASAGPCWCDGGPPHYPECLQARALIVHPASGGVNREDGVVEE